MSARSADRGKGWAFLSGSRGEAKWIVLLFCFSFFFYGSYRIFNLNLRISSGCCFFLVGLSDDDIFVRQYIKVSCQENVLKNQDTTHTHTHTCTYLASFSSFAHLRLTGLNILNYCFQHEISRIDTSRGRELGSEVELKNTFGYTKYLVFSSDLGGLNTIYKKLMSLLTTYRALKHDQTCDCIVV